MNTLLHYKALAEFRYQFYRSLLTQEHLKEGEVRINKVAFADGSEDDNFNFWGYRFDRDGVRYLLPAVNSKGEEITLNTTLPIQVKTTQKIAYRGDVFQLIIDYASARPRAQQTMTFRQLVDSLSGLKHSNPEHQKLLWFMGLTQMFTRANFRICTPAGFGKDSVVATLNNFVGGCASIVKPSRPKLEYRAATVNYLVINEVTKVPKADWELIEPFLLDAGDFKPTIEKQTLGYGVVHNQIDLKHFSIGLFYNDIDHLQSDEENFIDLKAHKALLNRFPAFRLYGHFEEDFNEILGIDVPQFVTQHFDEYKRLLYAITYYKQHYTSLLHRYDRSKLRYVESERWKTNIGLLLHTIDIYCKSQEEFDHWITIINDSLTDYEYMLQHKDNLSRVEKRLGPKEYAQFSESIKKAYTYKEKRHLIDVQLNGGTTTTYSDDKGLW